MLTAKHSKPSPNAQWTRVFFGHCVTPAPLVRFSSWVLGVRRVPYDTAGLIWSKMLRQGAKGRRQPRGGEDAWAGTVRRVQYCNSSRRDRPYLYCIANTNTSRHSHKSTNCSQNLKLLIFSVRGGHFGLPLLGL